MFFMDPRRQYEIRQRSLYRSLKGAASFRFPLEKRNRKLRRQMEDNLIFELKSALKSAREMQDLARQIEELYPDGPDHYCFRCKDEIFEEGKSLWGED